MQKNDGSYKWLILMGLVLAFVLRFGYILTMEDGIFWVDEEDYLALGHSLAQGQGYVNQNGDVTAFRPPGYPLFLAGLELIGIHSLFAIRVVQALLAVITLLFMALITKRYMGPAAAFLSVIAAAGYPYFVYMTGTVLATSWFSMILVASVYFLIIGAEEKRSLKIIASGLLMGLSILTRTSAAVLGLAALMWLMMWKPRSEYFQRVLLYGFCMALVVAPWGWRNYRALGAFTLSTNGGRNLWLGNNPESTINTGSNIEMPKELWDRIDAASEIQADRIYIEEAKKHIADNPAHYFLLSVKKGLSLWRFDPSPTTRGYSRLKKLYPFASVASYTPIFFMAIVGFLLAQKKQRRIMLLWILFAAAFTLLHAIFIAKVRFRLPLDHFLIIMAASGVTSLAQRSEKFRRFWHLESQTGMDYEGKTAHTFAYSRRL